MSGYAISESHIFNKEYIHDELMAPINREEIKALRKRVHELEEELSNYKLKEKSDV